MFNLLLWLFIIFIALQLFFRYVFPFLMKFYLSRITKRFNGMVNQAEVEQKRKKEGEINVKYKPESGKSKPQIGEYVDYEEIE